MGGTSRVTYAQGRAGGCRRSRRANAAQVTEEKSNDKTIWWLIAHHEYLMRLKFKRGGQSHLLSDGSDVLRAGAAVEEEEDDRLISVDRDVDMGWGVLDGAAADTSDQKCKVWQMLQIHLAKEVQVKMQSLLTQNSFTFLCAGHPHFIKSILWKKINKHSAVRPLNNKKNYL